MLHLHEISTSELTEIKIYFKLIESHLLILLGSNVTQALPFPLYSTDSNMTQYELCTGRIKNIRFYAFNDPIAYMVYVKLDNEEKTHFTPVGRYILPLAELYYSRWTVQLLTPDCQRQRAFRSFKAFAPSYK